jgi:outer membrane receptor for monomeric catechols
MKINESNIWQSAGASLGFQTKINNKSDLNISVDYLHYYNENPSGYITTHYFIRNMNKYEVSQIDLKKNTPISFIIGKADYTYNVSRALTIETGLKGVLSKLNNDVLVQKFQNNEWIIDSFFTSNSTLDEQIAAAYFSTKLHLPKQWEVNTGLRYEYDHTALSALNKKYHR